MTLIRDSRDKNVCAYTATGIEMLGNAAMQTGRTIAYEEHLELAAGRAEEEGAWVDVVVNHAGSVQMDNDGKHIK